MVVWAVSLSTTDLITRSLTPMLMFEYSEFDKVWYPGRALAFSVLYPSESAHEAIPKDISERTSYHGV